jgi:NADH-quinone oxidoreductase subunit N
MLLIMFSMVGIPPTVGFYAKLAVLQAALSLGDIGIVLAIIAILFSAVGAFYYLRVVKLMYFDPPTDAAPIAPRADVRVLMSLNGVAVLYLGIMPGPLMSLCLISIQASL